MGVRNESPTDSCSYTWLAVDTAIHTVAQFLASNHTVLMTCMCQIRVLSADKSVQESWWTRFGLKILYSESLRGLPTVWLWGVKRLYTLLKDCDGGVYWKHTSALFKTVKPTYQTMLYFQLFTLTVLFSFHRNLSWCTVEIDTVVLMNVLKKSSLLIPPFVRLAVAVQHSFHSSKNLCYIMVSFMSPVTVSCQTVYLFLFWLKQVLQCGPCKMWMLFALCAIGWGVSFFSLM